MSIIELLIYIALIASFLVSGVFAAYSMLISVTHDSDHIETKIEQQNSQQNDQVGQSGFVATIVVVIISTILLLTAVGASSRMALLYDSVMHSEYRLASFVSAYTCMDQAVLALAQDYFYSPRVDGDALPVSHCVIDSIARGGGSVVTITTTGLFVGIRTRIVATVQLESNFVKILYKKFILF